MTRCVHSDLVYKAELFSDNENLSTLLKRVVQQRGAKNSGDKQEPFRQDLRAAMGPTVHRCVQRDDQSFGAEPTRWEIVAMTMDKSSNMRLGTTVVYESCSKSPALYRRLTAHFNIWIHV